MAKSKLKSNAEKVPRKEKDELRICFRVRFFICGGVGMFAFAHLLHYLQPLSYRL